jgi:hypothetical protein
MPAGASGFAAPETTEHLSAPKQASSTSGGAFSNTTLIVAVALWLLVGSGVATGLLRQRRKPRDPT